MRQTVKELREAWGLTPAEAAKRLGLRIDTYNKWEEKDTSRAFYKMYYLLTEGMTIKNIIDEAKEDDTNGEG